MKTNKANTRIFTPSMLEVSRTTKENNKFSTG